MVGLFVASLESKWRLPLSEMALQEIILIWWQLYFFPLAFSSPKCSLPYFDLSMSDPFLGWHKYANMQNLAMFALKMVVVDFTIAASSEQFKLPEVAPCTY